MSVSGNISRIDAVNSVIDSLNLDDKKRVLDHCEPVKFSRGTLILPAHQTIDYIYFITSGMVSLCLSLSDGATVEIGVIGSEGTLGWQAAVGMDMGPIEASVQIEMTGYRIKTSTAVSLIHNIVPLRIALLRGVQTLLDQVSQSAACSQRHTSVERLAKWLLMAHDRAATETLHLSHETLSVLLGIRRAGVTVAMGELRRKGCVENGHGKIQIVNRSRLESSSCECYRAMQQEAERRTNLSASID